MTTPLPGPAASVLSAILVTGPDDPSSPMSRATFSQSGEAPGLPSLMNDVVAMPQDGLLDANGTWTGFLSTLGLTGATAPARWVGGTASGAPATGTFLAGDFVVDQTGKVWICTVAGSPGTWAAGSGSGVASVTAADTSVVVGGTGTNPTVRTGTLDVIATDHPPAAAWSNNLKKIQSLGNGSAASDAAAFGQTIGSILTTLGDIAYENATPAPARLAGNTTATKNFLTQTGTGSVSAAPAWGTLAFGDLPADGTVPAATSTTGATGSASTVPRRDHVHAQNYGGVFGDGSDGSVTFDGSTTILGMVPSSSTYTMTRDIFCTSVTINNSVTVKPAGFRIFCQGTFTNNGTVSANGAAGNNNGNATASTGSGTLGAGRAGSAGNTGAGTAGGQGGPGTGTTSGAGGNGNTGGSNAGGAAATPITTGIASPTSMFRAGPAAVLTGFAQYGQNSGAGTIVGGGGSGGGGGGDGTNKGGGGGAGGGMIAILAWSIVNNGTFTATGGGGGSPATGICGGGGGGSGGLVLGYSLSAWTAGTITLTGGGGGTHIGTGGTDGGGGSTGNSLNVVLA